MSDKCNRFTLRFSKNNSEQQSAYRTLQSIPAGKRTDFICKAINLHILNEELDDLVYRAVKRALDENTDISIQEYRNSQKAGEIRDDIMDFLKSL